MGLPAHPSPCSYPTCLPCLHLSILVTPPASFTHAGPSALWDRLVEVKQGLPRWAAWALCSPCLHPPIYHGTCFIIFLDMRCISHPWSPSNGVSGEGGELVQATLGSFIYVTSLHLEAAEFATSEGWGPPERRGLSTSSVWTAGPEGGRDSRQEAPGHPHET